MNYTGGLRKTLDRPYRRPSNIGRTQEEIVMSTYTLFPAIEPNRTGRLRVSDLHEIHYEEVGNPAGMPALFLHGGPGAGIIPAYRQFFDPKSYHVVLPDQRGAGKSTPHAELRENTTWDIVEDLEMLRKHLKIERWLVLGGSWGSLLALCYAIKHPKSVSGIIIRGVCLGRKWETEWLHKYGCSAIYPDQWAEYQSLIPENERGDMVKAYYKRLTEGTEAEQMRAAAAWTKWEAATMNLVPDPAAMDDFLNDKKAVAIGRIECYYTLKDWFLESDNWVLEHVSTIKDIPMHIVQGRYDVICPPQSAWDLHQALPKSKLTLVQLGAHSPLDPAMIHELVKATEEFKTQARW
jgi:proline iminopeptidase